MMREKETGEIENNLIKSYHIDLSYLDNISSNNIDELEKACLLFKELEEQIRNVLRGDKIMDEAYEELERISQDKNIIGLYDKEKVEQKNNKYKNIRCRIKRKKRRY